MQDSVTANEQFLPRIP